MSDSTSTLLSSRADDSPCHGIDLKLSIQLPLIQQDYLDRQHTQPWFEFMEVVNVRIASTPPEHTEVLSQDFWIQVDHSMAAHQIPFCFCEMTRC